MSNINLSVGGPIKTNVATFKFSHVAVFGALIMAFAVYGGLLATIKVINGRMAQTDAEYAVKKAQLLSSSDNQEIFDLQKRIELEKTLISSKSMSEAALTGIENSMVDGVAVSKLDYDKDKQIIAVSGTADNLYSLSKQILAFKKSGVFDENIGNVESKTNDNGSIGFALQLNIINNSKK